MKEKEAKALVHAADCHGYTLVAQLPEIKNCDWDWEVYFPGRVGNYLKTDNVDEALEGIETAFGIQTRKDAKLALRLVRLGVLRV